MNNCQFKFKPDKIKYLSNIDTLDSTHKKTIEKFNNKRDDVPKKSKYLDKLKYDLEELDKTSISNSNYISQRAKLLEDIGMLEEEIATVENYEDEIDYYSKTYDILFKYYDIIDGLNPKEIEETQEALRKSATYSSSVNNITSNSVIVENIPNNNFVNDPIDSFFTNTTLGSTVQFESVNTETESNFRTETNSDVMTNLHKPNTESTNNFNIDGIEIFNSKSNKLDLLNQLSKMKRKEKKTTRKRVKNVESLVKDNNNIFDYIDSNKINQASSPTENNNVIKYDRASLYEDYKIVLEGYISKKKNTKPCINCGIDKILIYNEGIYACMKCGEVENCIVESEITNYKDPMIEKPTFPYKRKNHFCEWNFILNCSLEWILKRFANVNYLI